MYWPGIEAGVYVVEAAGCLSHVVPFALINNAYSLVPTSQRMLHPLRKDQPFNAIYYKIHMEHVNTLCGQNMEFLIVKPCMYSDHCLCKINGK
jgi:hypothetical protein